MANYYGPLTHRTSSDVSTVVDPRFGTAATPVQPPGWGEGGGGGVPLDDGAVWVDTDYTGTTDASADINAAIAAAYAAGSSVLATRHSPPVRLRPGVLRLDSPILVHPRTQLVGSGMRATKLVPYGNVTAIGQETTYGVRDDVTIRDLEIDASNQTAGSGAEPKGIYITQGKRVQMLNLYVHDTWRTGIGIDFITGLIHGCWVVNNGRSNAARASGSHPGNSGIGIGLQDVEGTTEQLVISGNLAAGCSNFGIFVETQSGNIVGRGVVITGNTCRDNGRGGISDAGGSGVLIAANTCIDNDGAGIAVDYGTMGVQPNKGRPGARTLIESNMLDGNAYGVHLETAGDWDLDSPHVRGNTIHGNASHGILGTLDGTGAHANAWMVGNAIHDNGGDGIHLTGAASVARLAVTDNRIWDNVGAAVSVDTPTTASRIWGNEAWSNGSGVYFDTAKSHTGHRIDTSWVEGANTLPS